MSFPEYQSPGVRTARGTRRSLSLRRCRSPRPNLSRTLPGLNVFPKLPAGTIINIAGHLYRTLNDLDRRPTPVRRSARSCPWDRRGPRSSGPRIPAFSRTAPTSTGTP